MLVSQCLCATTISQKSRHVVMLFFSDESLGSPVFYCLDDPSKEVGICSSWSVWGNYILANKTNWCTTWPSSRIHYSETAEFSLIDTPLFIQCLGLDSPSFRAENPQNPSDIEYGVPLQTVNCQWEFKKNKATKQSPPPTAPEHGRPRMAHLKVSPGETSHGNSQPSGPPYW